MIKFTACAILVLLRVIYHPAPVNNNGEAFRQPASQQNKTVIIPQPQAPAKKIIKRSNENGNNKVVIKRLSVDIERDLLELENLFYPMPQYLVSNTFQKLAPGA